MLIYPNIVNMLGEMTIDINAMCLDRTQTYIMMIEQRMTASCMVLNPSIARCTVPRIYDWGTKTVYFQPQTGKAMDEKAYVGYVYFGLPLFCANIGESICLSSSSNVGPDEVGHRQHL